MSGEQWKPIPGTEGAYEVSDHGRVRSMTRKWTLGNGQKRHVKGRILKLQTTPKGYLTVRIRDHVYRVHRLVLQAFIGPCPDGMEGAHLNGAPSDCRLENLAWVTSKENARHRIIHRSQRMPNGWPEDFAQPHAILTPEQAREIFLTKGSMTNQAWANELGVSANAIYSIRARLSWRHVTAALALAEGKQ